MENSNISVAEASKLSLPGAFPLLREALAYYRSHINLILGISAAPFLLGVLQILIGEWSGIASVVFAIVASLAGFLAQMALLVMVVKGEQTVGSAYRTGLSILLSYAWVALLVGLAALGGLVLLVIPGIMVSISLSLAVYVFLAEDRRGMAALARSWYYVKGYWWPVFWRFIFFGLIFLIISIVLMMLTGGPSVLMILNGGMMAEPEVSLLSEIIGLIFNSLIVVPLSIAYYYSIYSSIKALKSPEASEADTKKYKKNLTIFIVIGVIGVVAILGVATFFAIKAGLVSSRF